VSGQTRRIAVLLAALGVVAALVVVDRAGIAAGGEAGGEGVSARRQYLRQAAVVEEMRQFVAQREQWRAAHESAQDQWRDIRADMLEGRTTDVAAAQLEERVDDVLVDLGLRPRVSSMLPSRTPLDGEGLRVVGLSLGLEAPNPDALYALVDRLENLPGVMTNISALSVRGPARRPGAGLDVEIDLRALAWVEGGGPRG